jgi:hypothetical protein
MGYLNLKNTKPMTRYVKGGFRGCYIGLRANFDANLNVWYSIKVGKGTGQKGAIGRCDDQALPALFLFDGYNVGIKPNIDFSNSPFPIFCEGQSIYNLERMMMEQARKTFGEAPLLYSFAGSTETFGNFQTPKAAYLAAKLIADSIATIDVESEFTNEPLQIVDYFKKGREAEFFI